jgi:hypothetical protein
MPSVDVPRVLPKLSDWSYDSIRELVNKGYLETDRFDFKLEIKSREPDHHKRIARTACAFANTMGGFVIFGVRDMGMDNRAHIEGIELSDDLAKQFGDKINSINPTPYFDFSNPPIRIPSSDRVLFVAEIPQSPDRPHMCENTFFYRTNNGNEIMSYEQVREAFQRYDERRSKLNLLYLELLYNRKIAERLSASANSPRTNTEYLSSYFDLTAMSDLLPEVYSVIWTDKSLVRDLFEVRMKVADVNSRIAMLDRKIDQDLRNRDITNHNESLRVDAPTIQRIIDRIIDVLESRFHLTNPLRG